MKKLNSNIFAENIHTQIDLDEKKAINTAKKILSFYLNDQKILESSCLNQLDFKTLSFDILFCDSKKTHEINKEYRQKDYAADIITFAIFADSEEKFIFDKEINLGEIIISLDKVEELAKEKSSDFKSQVNFLIAHGIMHLLGFDHQTDEEYNFIVETQDSALQRLEVK